MSRLSSNGYPQYIRYRRWDRTDGRQTTTVLLALPLVRSAKNNLLFTYVMIKPLAVKSTYRQDTC